MKIEFTVPGEPRGKGRPRFTKSGCVYTDAKTEEYERQVKIRYAMQYNTFSFEKNVPLKLQITAYFAIPKSASVNRRNKMKSNEILPTKRPDADNIEKIIMDSLNKLAYYDDAQIIEVVVKKYYGDNPCVSVLIEDIENDI